MTKPNNCSKEIDKQNDMVVLESLAEGLEAARKQKGKCPSQNQGKEVDGTISNYCPLSAIPCEHKGPQRCYDLNEGTNLVNHSQCRYEGDKK